jgi:hypothetical protein
MRKRARFVIGGMAMAVMALLLSARVLSQEKTGPQPPREDEMAKMMAKWKELNAKGPEHEKFKSMVGMWKAETKMWMAPNAPPTVSRGTA